MKTKSYLTIGLLLLAVGLFALSSYRTTAQQGHQRQPHAVVIIGNIDVGYFGVDGYGQTRFIQTGMGTLWIDGSQYAPQIPPSLTNSLSAVIAFMMDEGFTHELLSPGRHLFKR